MVHYSYFPAGGVIAAVFYRFLLVQQLETHRVLAIDQT